MQNSRIISAVHTPTPFKEVSCAMASASVFSQILSKSKAPAAGFARKIHDVLRLAEGDSKSLQAIRTSG